MRIGHTIVSWGAGQQWLVTWQASTAGPLGGGTDFSLPTRETGHAGHALSLGIDRDVILMFREPAALAALAKPLDTMLRRATLHDAAGSHCKALDATMATIGAQDNLRIAICRRKR